VLLAIGLLAVSTLLTEHGFVVDVATTFWVHVVEALLAGGYVADRVLMCLRGTKRWRIVRERQFEYGVLALFALLAVGLACLPAGAASVARFLHEESSRELGAQLLKLFLLANVLVQLLRAQQRLLQRVIRPEWILAGSFALLILAGTLLLLLPRASAAPERPIGFLDALFTATIASCVTGLTVLDTGTAFSVFGQGILVALFQVGGLGIMTFVAFLAITSAEALPVPQMLAFRQLVGARTPAAMRRQVWAILAFTLLVEAAGVACLYACLPPEGDRLARLGWSVFHSVSAFCNAGFALSGDSLTALQGHAGAMLTFMGLIVLGGLGFLVVTVVLIVAGLAGFWILEDGKILSGKPLETQFWISAFQSVTTRTAGFNTVPMDQLQPATLLLLIALMAVGACPISTGGGIKTVTFAVLLLALRAFMTGREQVEIRGRALPQRVLLAALTVLVLYVFVASLGVFGLVLCDPQIRLRSQMFEAVSALSTVGLSTGITAHLSPGSQLILCVLMFIGRVGPISVVLSVVRSQRPTRYQYPEEDLVVG